ncbi:MAG: DNA repair protein RadA [Patescibacteria group bacterium]
MAKPTTIYVCSKCDAQTPKWSGRCLSCGAWGTLHEENTEQPSGKPNDRQAGVAGTLKSFADDVAEQAKTRPTKLPALDMVLGGGLVDGSVTLLAGEPGIGKSTFLAQLSLAMSDRDGRIMYITGEESPSQIQRRLHRLVKDIPPNMFFLNDTDAPTVAATIEKEKPALTIIDSIQTMSIPDVSGDAGSVSQVRACAALLTQAAKESHLPLILVGQVTKEGDVAGPRVLEHVVDTVLFLEGDHEHRYRVLRALKHRFGPTDEVALLAMTEMGLQPVLDPSSELLHDRATGISGSSVTAIIEGRRPMLLEIQSLVSPAGYGTPIRRGTGVDSTRLGMLLAVLARRAGVNVLEKDVHANAAGGIDARDPSVDLALAVAIASAAKDAPLDPRLGLFGEIGLAGELRPVALPEMRLKELARMGFLQAIVPKGQSKNAPKGLEVKEAATLREALQIIRIL